MRLGSSAGHGGQIVLSDVTAGLIRDETDVVDLGEHRLAGVERAIRLWQVGGRQFPPLRTTTAVAGNLPSPLDSFVGRSEELVVLSGLIATHRLVTVVGVDVHHVSFGGPAFLSRGSARSSGGPGRDRLARCPVPADAAG